MIYKAIVEEILDAYSIRVRIPKLDRVKSDGMHTNSSDLRIAIISSIPNCNCNFQVGDIVLVYVDDDCTIIIGYLFKAGISTTLADIKLSSVDIINEAKLPLNTNIGEVTYLDLCKLKGTKDNVQKQINSLVEIINQLQEKITSLETKINDGKE